MIPVAVTFVDRIFGDIRFELLKGIKGKVLDVGCATGVYLKYYSKHADKLTHVVMLEPNRHMHEDLRRNISRCKSENPNMSKVPVEVEGRFLEELPASDDGTFDWVILGNVLCEVPDPTETLRQVHRLLKVGGRVFYTEHVAQKKGTISRFLQDTIQPYWVRISDGCNINRCSLDTIRNQEGLDVINWSVPMSSLAPIEIGLAVKRR
jgi:ubiquinone/menaquinone biosynthesis C-methylase UbiE